MGFNFFLYGVYDQGQVCYGRFKNFIQKAQPAVALGTLYRLQCGLHLLLNQGSQAVAGTAVQLELTDSQWTLLDGLNGCGLLETSDKSIIIKEKLTLRTTDGDQLELAAYCLNPQRKDQTQGPLDAGAAGEMRQQSLLEKLTEKQRTYIYKLARARGREIIPVDLALYRELMSLELIVDKGRRLALTPLGQEVSHFL